MKRFFLLSLVIIFFVATDNLKASDWRFYGCTTSSKGECTEMIYFDAGSIQYFKNGTLRVWTKSIAQSEVQKYFQNKEILRSAAEKIEQGYFPPYIIERNLRSDRDWYVTVVDWEETANYQRIKSKTKFLHQIDCHQRTTDSLTRIWFKKDGTIESTSDRVYSSLPISPDSNGEMLYRILCRGSEWSLEDLKKK